MVTNNNTKGEEERERALYKDTYVQKSAENKTQNIVSNFEKTRMNTYAHSLPLLHVCI